MANKKNLAVMTMIRDDHHWARVWLKHYLKQVESRRDLYIILHGDDPYLSNLFAGCSVITVPLLTKDLSNFERQRLDFEHFFIRSLQAYFKCVILVDVDELLTTAPEVDEPLWQYLPKIHNGEMVRSALGLEVVDREEPGTSEIDLDAGILSQRPWVFCNAQYSKPCVFYFNFGGATHHRVWGAPWVIDSNLLLFHLRYCDRALRGQYVESRKQFYAEQKQSGRAASGNWKRPWKEFIATINDVEQRPEAVLEREVREQLRHDILQDFVRTNRVGKVASGYLKLPTEYEKLL